ncbi:ABC transporter transmembrane domain-containing protein [Candidatus Avoscillospira sp. LCP25S3_F1]|uniref:ABC transporter transmembrane domain-containing protein n=1 Tax=Candidatus Avoscillospira sp. LCP25S3_F1 TaxID=3438825 RepID=UPI003F91CDBA
MMINKRLLAMVPESMPWMVRKVAVNWLSLAAGIVLWFTVAWILDRLQQGRSVGMETAAAFLVCAACIAVRFALTRAATVCTYRAASCVKGKLRTALYGKLRRLGGGYTDAFPTAEVVQLAGEGVEQLESYFGNYVPQIFYALLAPLTLLCVFLPLSPLTALTLFVCVPLIPAAIMAVQKVARRLLSKYWDAYANLGDSFLENLQGLTTLKVYGADAARHQAMNREAEQFRRVTMKVLTMQLNSVTIMDFVAYGGASWRHGPLPWNRSLWAVLWP